MWKHILQVTYPGYKQRLDIDIAEHCWTVVFRGSSMLLIHNSHFLTLRKIELGNV